MIRRLLKETTVRGGFERTEGGDIIWLNERKVSLIEKSLLPDEAATGGIFDFKITVEAFPVRTGADVMTEAGLAMALDRFERQILIGVSGEAELTRSEILAHNDALRAQLAEARADKNILIESEAELHDACTTAERERDEARALPFYAFVEGVRWWQFHSQGATIFPSERDEAEAEAKRRYPFAPHPFVVLLERERDELARIVGVAICAFSLADGESLIDPPDHALVAGAVECARDRNTYFRDLSRVRATLREVLAVPVAAPGTTEPGGPFYAERTVLCELKATRPDLAARAKEECRG